MPSDSSNENQFVVELIARLTQWTGPLNEGAKNAVGFSGALITAFAPVGLAAADMALDVAAAAKRVKDALAQKLVDTGKIKAQLNEMAILISSAIKLPSFKV